MGNGDITALGNAAAMSILDGMRALGELPGYDLTRFPPKTVIRMMTSDGPCTLVVVDPKHLTVVLFRHPAERFGSPRFATLRGAGLNGHLKVGWILSGTSADFDLDNGERLLIKEVVSMFPPGDAPEEADVLIREAKRRSS